MPPGGPRRGQPVVGQPLSPRGPRTAPQRGHHGRYLNGGHWGAHPEPHSAYGDGQYRRSSPLLTLPLFPPSPSCDQLTWSGLVASLLILIESFFFWGGVVIPGSALIQIGGGGVSLERGLGGVNVEPRQSPRAPVISGWDRVLTRSAVSRSPRAGQRSGLWSRGPRRCPHRELRAGVSVGWDCAWSPARSPARSPSSPARHPAG